ncbi:MAG: transposase zinc-binding domain-containing protein [Bacteroidia bacterium]
MVKAANNPKELAYIIQKYLAAFTEKNEPLKHHLRVLNAIGKCRTAALGGHVDKCNNSTCNHIRISYNSCRNRHCPSPRWIL